MVMVVVVVVMMMMMMMMELGRKSVSTQPINPALSAAGTQRQVSNSDRWLFEMALYVVYIIYIYNIYNYVYFLRKHDQRLGCRMLPREWFCCARPFFFENYQQPYFAMVKLSKLAMLEDSKNAKKSVVFWVSLDPQRWTLGLKVKEKYTENQSFLFGMILNRKLWGVTCLATASRI